MHVRLRKHLATLCALLMLVMCVGVLGACTFSETITQTIYDQDPSNEVDETKTLLVNSLKAKETSESLPQLTNDDSKKEKQETEEDLPTYGGDTSDALVKAPKESEKDKNQDAETDNSTTDNDTNTAQRSGTQQVSEQGDGDTGAKKSSKENGSDGSGSKKGEGDNPDNTGGGQKDSGKGKKNKDNEVKVYEDYGEFAEIPTGVKHVTAVGQAAVIVSMLGGAKSKTPLLGADAELLENATARKVLASKGIAKVKKIWKSDGSSEGDLKDVQDVIDLDPELCFTLEGDETFTEKQRQALLDENIIVYVLPNMSSASKICYAVQLVGDILEAGGNAQAGELAKSYQKFHDGLVSELTEKNGGLTGGFNFDTGKKVSTKAKLISSLYISDWDEDAVYDDPNGYLSSKQGVGIAEMGYENHPVSYYMSVGGALNNAAADSFRSMSGYTMPVWQFSLTQAPCAWANWDSIDRSKASYAVKGDGFNWALLWSTSGDCGLGTDNFPAALVATAKMKSLMESDASRNKGLYYPYPRVESSHGGLIHNYTVGFSSGTNLVYAGIGKEGIDSSVSVLNDGTAVDMYDVYVNPAGGFSNWADGSVESVLEAPWVYQTFRDQGYDSAGKVKEFYNSFYGYSLSDAEVQAVLAGENG